MSTKEPKKYGLILKKKPTTGGIVKKPSIFGDDDSSDEEKQGRQMVNKTIKKEAEKNRQMRQTQLEINKVLEEDPTAYDYDKIYDEMVEKKTNLLAAKSVDVVKKPKYIGNLLKFAERRKREEERRVERQVQKERETEGEKFSDKEAFVTGAYRQKMQELAEDEERQRKLDELEGDVTKQTDLSKFYRNLLDRNVSTGGSYNTENSSTGGQVSTTSANECPTGTQGGRKRDSGSDRDSKNMRATTSDGRDKSEHHRPRNKSENDGDRERPEHDRHREGSDDDRHKDRSVTDRRREKADDRHRKRSEGNRDTSADHRSHRLSSKDGDRVGDTSKDDKPPDVSADVATLRQVPKDDGDRVRASSEDDNDSEKKDGKDDTDSDGSDRKETMEETREKTKRKQKEEEKMTSKLAKHSSKETVLSAKERYLARKKNRVVVKITSDDED